MRATIVGGGLAGLAAAVALRESGAEVELFEARHHLGGRAGSFADTASGELVDYCQHVSMGCCTNLDDFCRRTGLDRYFRRDARLVFFGPDGHPHRLHSSALLPAPFHLLPALVGLDYLSLRERLGIARAMWRLARLRDADTPPGQSFGDWLRGQGQSEAAIRNFWAVVLVSALSESLDRIAVRYARQVFVSGFLASRKAYHVLVPTLPLREVFGRPTKKWLREQGVSLHLGRPVKALCGDASGVRELELAGGDRHGVENVVLALPWRRCADMAPAALKEHAPALDAASRIESAPITGIHLWFDRPLTELPHAVLVDRLSQWLFNRGAAAEPGEQGYYYQVVVSASRELSGRSRAEIIAEVCRELREVFPDAHDAQLLHSRLVTDPAAVFSVRPGIDELRPPQSTPVPNLFLAGDWTRTGWPSTMESAIRSGYLAAESLLAAHGQPKRLVAPDLRPALLTRLLLRPERTQNA